MDSYSFLVILGIAIALGCDTFAVGLAVGTALPGGRARFRLSFHFGLFQFLMPLLGWGAGQTLIQYIGAFDHWVAFGLLSLVAIKMFFESLREPEALDLDSLPARSDPTSGYSLIALSIATSMDALGFGFSMGVSGHSPWDPAILMGAVASLMTYAGIRLGSQLSMKFGKRAETLGAIVLFAIAVQLLRTV